MYDVSSNMIVTRSFSYTRAKLTNILLLIYSAAVGFRYNLIEVSPLREILPLRGMLPLNEIMAVVLLPVFFWKDKDIIRRYPDAKKILICFILYGTLLVLSDLYNESVPHDYLRGWANVFMLIVNFIFLLYLFDKGNDYLILFYIAGGIVAGYFAKRYELPPGHEKYLAVYVFPIVRPILLIGFVYLYKMNRRFLAAVICIFFGVFCLANNSRSQGGVWFVAGCILLVFLIIPRQILFRKKVLIIAGLSGFIILYLLYATYIFAVTELEWGGPHGKDQVKRCKNPYNPLELLLQGRGDFFVSFQAFLDRPLLGYGSWGHDESLTYRSQLADIAGTDFNYRRYIDKDWIPAHSALAGSLVWAGIGAGLIWLYIFLLFVRKFNLCLKYYSGPLLPIIAVTMFEIYWAFFFSPIMQTRMYVPVWMSWLIVFTSNLKYQHSIYVEKKSAWSKNERP